MNVIEPVHSENTTCRCFGKPQFLSITNAEKENLAFIDLMTNETTGFVSDKWECNKEGSDKCVNLCFNQVSQMTNNLDLYTKINEKTFVQNVCDQLGNQTRNMRPSRLFVSGQLSCFMEGEIKQSSTMMSISIDHSSKNFFNCVFGQGVVF